MLSKNYAQEGRVDIKPPTGLVRVENGNRGHNRLGLGVGLRSWLHGNIELAGTEQRRHPAVAEHWPRSDTATAVT